MANVRRYARPGAVIVFHDSLKAAPRVLDALPRALEWLLAHGYAFGVLDYDVIRPNRHKDCIPSIDERHNCK